MTVLSSVKNITRKIIERSHDTRSQYLEQVDKASKNRPHRSTLSCGNLAHGFAACGIQEKSLLAENQSANIGIITSFNDMLSAHQPFETYPALIKKYALENGASAQVAGGVPAMCDGVTQGQPGMDLSLFSRDLIAMSASVGLSHNMFDAAIYLGVCDKIVPGLFIAALTFGHLPAIFIPAGPMPSGLPNDEKAKTRQLYAEGKIDRAVLLASESKSYHSPGTCTFYGTANSNQMLMEIMGLHTPGSTFANPGTKLREALIREATKRASEITALGSEFIPVGRMIDERSFVNAIVGLLTTGGSTNHTLHLIAMARAAGILINWQDISDLSDIVPLLVRIYPNGLSDVNHFNAAGGMGYLISQLCAGGYLHEDVQTVWGHGLNAYKTEAKLDEDGKITRHGVDKTSGEPKILTSYDRPFQKTGGLKIIDGNLGRAVAKISAVKPEFHSIEAPAKVFNNQEAFQKSFDAGELTQDFVAILRFQGPSARGMPELHKLTPLLGILQDRGLKVALVTDGRMSGASGKILSAIHLTPEAAKGGAIAKIQDGDKLSLNATTGHLNILMDQQEFDARPVEQYALHDEHSGMGRELFSKMRAHVSGAELGASIL